MKYLFILILYIVTGIQTVCAQFSTSTGFAALFGSHPTYGLANTATGYYSLTQHSSPLYSSAHGAYAMYWDLSAKSSAYGAYALYFNYYWGGAENTAVGASAMGYSLVGSRNSAAGHEALYNNWESYNTAVGSRALYFIGGGYNVGLGYNAGISSLGNNCTFIGTSTANFNSTSVPYTNTTIIHSETYASDISNEIRCGNALNSTSVGNSGLIGFTSVSDRRIKKNIRENIPGLAFITKLAPVTYNLDINSYKKLTNYRAVKSEDSNKNRLTGQENIVLTGFLAQDVESAAKSINYEASAVNKPQNANDLYSLRYTDLVVPLVKAVQELDMKDKALREKVVKLKAMKDELLKRVKQQQSKETILN
jgi:hypothetical protein